MKTEENKKYWFEIQPKNKTFLDELNGFKKPTKKLYVAETEEKAIKQFEEDYGKDNIESIKKKY